MPLRIDPRIPIVWRDPSTLQVGVDPPRVILTEVDAVDERLIAALGPGVGVDALRVLAESLGAAPDRVPALLERLAPVLHAPRGDPPQRPAVAVCGAGATVDLLAEVLARSGARVTVAGTTAEAAGIHSDAAVVVAHHVVDPIAVGMWLRRDVRHLAIVYTDTGALVGPVVDPGRGPCLHCLERHRVDADPARIALATQLWGRRSAAETAATAAQAAALATRLLLADAAAVRLGEQSRVDAATGEVTRRVVPRHPACLCSDAALAGIGSPAATAPAPRPSRPRRDAVAAAPA